ncbi:salicylate hydroxylase-like protein [Pseudomassariella vexata]|uniref:Salicylate hydroxylase-like protein n=1 Tax=Pseudomassariella vexata TaxID=1141098 RepID=A0A1Y2DG74_9PEZI|nr:salicylate hydroxylase-like protein [Pseudomassariella vexata]ORY58084.1 salicylate hydroxylase-like protein [Pseudomassariella vexata]
MVTSPKPFSIAIIGGGIGGLTLAIGLLKHNVPFTIYESASQFGEVGAGLGMSPNGVRAMGLIDHRIKEGFLRCRTNNPHAKMQDVLYTVRVGDFKNANENGMIWQKGDRCLRVGDEIFDVPGLPELRGACHRAHFLDELVRLVPDSVAQFRKKLVDITETSGDVVLQFADGTNARHSAVVGCDGIKSRTRELILGPASKATFTGKCAYRGLVPMEKAIEVLGEDEARNSQLYMGYHGHILTYPIQLGSTLNIVAFCSRDSWTNPKWVLPASQEQVLADYSTWGRKTILTALENPNVWALFDHPPARTYCSGRVCLLGDAAHATSPHEGSGAGMVIEDAYILSSLIGGIGDAQDLDYAFKAYDEVRRPRMQKLVTTSRDAGMIYDLELYGDDLEAIEQNVIHRCDWIWGVDLSAEMERAKGICIELRGHGKSP